MDNYKSYLYTLVPIKGDTLIKVTAMIPIQYIPKPYWIYITTHTYSLLLSGASLASITSSISEDTFKFLESGPDLASDNLTEYKGFIQKAFVTNATANTIAYYAFVYLTNLNLSGKQINNLRVKYSLENLGSSFKEDEIRNSLINQSAFFLNLYKSMNENDRFIKMAESLDKDKFNRIFRSHDTIDSLRKIGCVLVR